MDSNSAPSTTESSVRGKCDPAWSHVLEEVKDGKSSFKCLYCGKVYRGGGINRMKRHLAGVKGDVASCRSVPYDVRFQMGENLKEIGKAKQQAKEDQANSNISPLEEIQEYEVVQENHASGGNLDRGKSIGPSRVSSKSNLGKRKVNGEIDKYFAPRTTPGAQLGIKSVLATKEAKKRVDMAIARFMYDACIPLNAVNSSYYQPMLNAIASIGPGYRGPNYHALRVPLLKEAKREVQMIVDSYRTYWAELGCTIMADGWTDNRQRTLINFLVYCSKGITFIRSVDASDMVKDAVSLFNLFDEIVKWVGPENVVQLVTDNAANYVAAGRLLCGKYRNICWSPCAAHCLNLILKDIGEMDHVANLAKRASQITVYIYNHVYLLSWLRNRKGWGEIVRPGPTRFATTFIALGSLNEHMHDLQALVTSKFFVESRYAKDKKAKEVVKIILDPKFWNDCRVIVHIVSPLIRLLRIVDSDEHPAMGYVYDGMYRAIDGIKKLFKDKKKFWEPYINIIKDRWDNQFSQEIHAAAYWLNPAFQYDPSTSSKRQEVHGALTDVIEMRVSSSRHKLVDELKLFRERVGTFGKLLALETSKTTQPGEILSIITFCLSIITFKV